MSRPLVLLHPLGSHGGFWQPVLEHLQATVLTPDLPGHGSTPPTSEPSLEEMGRAVLAELDRAGASQVDLVGLSIGGLVGQFLAATAPERIARLVLVDTVVTYPPEMREMWGQRAAAVRAAGGAGAFVGPTLDLWFTAGFKEAAGPVVAAAADAITRSPAEGYARACDLLADVDTARLLTDIACPTLVACGHDDAPPFRAAARQLEETLPVARLAWLPGRHAAAVENPREFVEVLRGFLDESDPRPTSTGGAP